MLKQDVPVYDESLVNDYLIAVKKESYVISSEDSDYLIWLEYLNIQDVFIYSEFSDINAGIALVRYYYINSKSCGMCECYPNLLLTFAYGGDKFFDQEIYNVSLPKKDYYCC